MLSPMPRDAPVTKATLPSRLNISTPAATRCTLKRGGAISIGSMRIGRGPLRPAELAEAAVLGDVSLVLVFVGWLLPLTPVFFAAATVPFAAIVVRRRLRALVLSAIASGQVAFLLGGINLGGNLLPMA